MSVLNLSGDECPECPLCMELLELDDINFLPCACGYQICRFCWNKLRTEGNGLCPACRQPYSENPADFKPLTSEQIAKIKAEKRLKDQAKKQKISENRKHLANVRVVQKNLVFVVGLSPRLADPEILKKPDYFGKFGKIHKVVINHSTQYAGSQIQGPSASAYVTYYKSEDALRGIQAVNNLFIDGRTLKASLGTTKYCSHFMKNQPCPKNDCMYLHELGDEAASFTKEEMQQGKHTDYEKQLHEDMLAGLSNTPPGGESPPSPQQSSEQERDRELYGGGIRERMGMVDPAWPDLGNSIQNKSRFVSSSSKEDEKSSKSKSCESSDEESPPPLPQDSTPPPAPDPVNNSKQLPPHLTNNQPQDSGWSERDVKISVSNNFLEEDDLGFDPFHETQKGLADLLESESKAAEAQLKQVITPEPEWKSTPPLSRTRAPPPGFHAPAISQPNPYTFMSDHSLNRILPANLESLYNRAAPLPGRSGLPGAPGFGQTHANPTEHLFSQLGKQNSVQDPTRMLFDHKQPLHSSLADGFGNKDWQDGLRALLPNVNVSFGANNPQQSQQQQFGMQGNFHNFDRIQPSTSNWVNNSGGHAHDWTTMDPAIVTGQLSHPDRGDTLPRDLLPGSLRGDLGFGRADSPPNWITANLEQLTSEPLQSYNSSQAANTLLPAFNSLGLGGARNGGPSLVGGQLGGGWGGGSSAAPPPGFGQHRPNQMQQHYSGFGLNKNTEAQKIGDF